MMGLGFRREKNMETTIMGLGFKRNGNYYHGVRDYYKDPFLHS